MITEGSKRFATKVSKQEFEEISERLSETNPNAVLCDGLEDALVGFAERFGMETVAAYDVDVKRDKMTPEQAREFFEFNVLGSGVDHAPVFVTISRDAFLI